jgi:hypothetical protein
MAAALPPFLRRDGVGIAVLWLVLGSVFAEVARRVHDYVDFDAARYEHLAFSIERTHSLTGYVNGVDIKSYSQLFPLLLSLLFTHGSVAHDFIKANVIDTYVMTSACIPAFFLTRFVTGKRWAAYFVATFTICMPWIVISTFMMTETVAYPVCTWAIFAIVVALARPTLVHDVLAVVAVALSFFARTELLSIALVLPLALVAYELLTAASASPTAPVVTATRSLVRGHPLLVAAYVIGGAGALVLLVRNNLSEITGVYSPYAQTTKIEWHHLAGGLAEHVATFSLGVGVLPFVIAFAWIASTVAGARATSEQRAFACAGAALMLAVFVQGANFDLQLHQYVHDRFFIYVVPVTLTGALLGVTARRPRMWAIAGSLALVVAGFVFGVIPAVTWKSFPWLDPDTPISAVYKALALHLGGMTPTRILLVAVVTAATACTALALGSRRHAAAIAVCTWLTVAMPVTTAVVYHQYFSSTNDSNGRPVTTSPHGSLDWIDETLGTGSQVTAISYPTSSDWFVSEQRWVDFEFWNKSIVRDAHPAGPDAFDYLGFWFPKTSLAFDATTGAVVPSPTRWAVVSDKETRFGLAGADRAATEDSILVDAGEQWRLSWLTSGLYDDGWTKPGVRARIRIFSAPGQRHAEIRTVSLVLRAPDNVSSRPVTITANGTTTNAVTTPGDTFEHLNICVPAHRYADLRLSTPDSSAIPGDLATLASFNAPRTGGVFIAALSVANEIGGSC